MENISKIENFNENIAILQGNNVQGNINITQITDKSVEYRELSSAVVKLEKYLSFIPETEPELRLEASVDLEKSRTHLQQFREGILRLAETFNKIEIKTSRFHLAKEHFTNGQFREANEVLDKDAIKHDLDAIILAREKNIIELNQINESLRYISIEWLIKAQITSIQYDNPNWFELTIYFFEESLLAQENLDNLFEFAQFLKMHNQVERLENLYLKTLLYQENESDAAETSNNLGHYYRLINQIDASEKYYLQALEIRERLAYNNDVQAEAYLSETLQHLGSFYDIVGQSAVAEKHYLKALKIRESLVAQNPQRFEPFLAETVNAMGLFYNKNDQLDLAEKYSLWAIQITEHLFKQFPQNFEYFWADTNSNLGLFYMSIDKHETAKFYYLRSLEVYEKLARTNPFRFEINLATTLNSLGLLHGDIDQNDKAEYYFLKGLIIYERLANNNPQMFDPNLASVYLILGLFYYALDQIDFAENYSLKSLEIYERLAKPNLHRFDAELAEINQLLGNLYDKKDQMLVAEKYYLKALEIYGQLVKQNPSRFESELSSTYGAYSYSCLFIQKLEEAEHYASLALLSDESNNWVRANLGHIYLLKNDNEKAKLFYTEYIINEDDEIDAKNTILQDLEDINAKIEISDKQLDAIKMAKNLIINWSNFG